MSKIGGSDSKNSLYCSFCGKSQNEVRKTAAPHCFSLLSKPPGLRFSASP